MIRINLLQPEKKEIREGAITPPTELKEKKRIPMYSIIILIAIIVIGGLYFNQKKTFNREQELLKNAQEERNKLKDVLVKLEQLENQKNLYEQKINLITQLKSRQEIAVRIMDELSKHIPDWVWLTEVSYKNQLINIKGKALSNNLIADYIFNLEEKSPYFHSVNLIGSTQKSTKKNRYHEFSLTAGYTSSVTSTPYKNESKGVKK